MQGAPVPLMVARHQDVLVGTAKHRCAVDYDLTVRCRGGAADRHPLHSICIGGHQQVEHLLSVVLVSVPDTLKEIAPGACQVASRQDFSRFDNQLLNNRQWAQEQY